MYLLKFNRNGFTVYHSFVSFCGAYLAFLKMSDIEHAHIIHNGKHVYVKKKVKR